MKKRYPPRLLFELRNHIPVAFLVAEILEIPGKTSDGYFRFLCPLCREYNTATNPKTNLARCFSCETNFNPIDLVMITQHKSFVEAVDFLVPLLPRNQTKQKEKLQEMVRSIGVNLCENGRVK